MRGPELEVFGPAMPAHPRAVLLLSNYPAPYRQPLFEAVGALLEAQGVQLAVYYAAPTEPGRDWEVELTPRHHRVYLARSSALGGVTREFQSFRYQGVRRLVRRLQPELALGDGFSIGATQLSFLLDRQRFGIWSGAIAREAYGQHWLRGLQRRWIARRASFAITLSEAACAYLVQLGLAENRITCALNCASPADHLERAVRQTAASRPFKFLYVGGLSPRKGVDRALRALASLLREPRAISAPAQLEIVGSGAEEGSLRSLCDELQLTDNVSFRGYLTGRELEQCYADADALLFPTRHDIWGLVVNEAMQAAVPVIGSIDAVASVELIVPGVTGYAVDFDDSDAVARCMALWVNQPERAHAAGIAARTRVVARASVKRSSKQWSEALLRALARVEYR